MKNKIINAIPSFIDNDSRYLYVDKDVKNIGSLGNILEWTGQLLMGLSTQQQNFIVKNCINLIVCNLKDIYSDIGLIPRVIDSEPRDFGDKAYRWEKKLKSISFEEIKTLNCRTDVSHSQFTFLIMGLYSVSDKSATAKLLLQLLIKDLYRNEFTLRRIDNKITNNGEFGNFGSQGLRRLFLYEIGKIYGYTLPVNELKLDINLLSIILLKKPFVFLIKNKIKLSESDAFNVWILLKSLSKIDTRYNKKFIKFNKCYQPKAPSETEIDIEINFENAIRYLLLK